jgi:hypothetical protein
MAPPPQSAPAGPCAFRSRAIDYGEHLAAVVAAAEHRRLPGPAHVGRPETPGHNGQEELTRVTVGTAEDELAADPAMQADC